MRVEIETSLIIPRLQRIQRLITNPEVAKAIIEVKDYVKTQEKLRIQDNEEMAQIFREDKI